MGKDLRTTISGVATAGYSGPMPRLKFKISLNSLSKYLKKRQNFS